MYQVKTFENGNTIRYFECAKSEFNNDFTNYRGMTQQFFPRFSYQSEEDKSIAEIAFNRYLAASCITNIVICINHDQKVVGVVLGNKDRLFEVTVSKDHRRKKIGTNMLKMYLENTSLIANGYKYVWESTFLPEEDPIGKFFNSMGFNLDCEVDAFSSTAQTSVAFKPGPNDFHKQRLNMACGYEDFRNGYVVVDGRYTLEQLESLFEVAKGKLKNV